MPVIAHMTDIFKPENNKSNTNGMIVYDMGYLCS